jgi:TolB-like protein/AraC-like DNA-binding protein
MDKSRENSMDQDFIQKLTRTVFDNLNNEQFGAEELAVQIGLSRSQIHRRLHQINGQSITQFIREIRLKEAHRLLEKEVGTASEIAYQVGFGSPTYFNKCFHEYYGYTPGEVKARQNKSGRKKKIINAKYLRTALILVVFLAISFFSYLFLPGYHSKSSDPVASQNEPVDAFEAKSITVIPFKFLGKDTTLNYYSDGMISEILNHLYKIGDLNVKSDILSKRFANSALTPREIGNAFGVSHILTGTIMLAGDIIRISPQLIDAQTNKVLWSETFTKRLSDISEILEMQSDVAKKVALGCKASISPEADQLIRGSRAPENKLAYEFYLKGQEYWKSKADVALALEMYSKAIEADPSYAPAYAKRSSMHAEAYVMKRAENWLDHDLLALVDIQKAIQFDPASLEAKFAQSVYNYYITNDYEVAMNILDDLKKKMPNMAELYAYSAAIKRRQGQWHESIVEMEKAVQLEPFNVGYLSSLGASYTYIREFDKAIEVYRMGLERVPDYKVFRRRIVMVVRKKTGNIRLALEVAGLEENDMTFEYYLFSRQFDKLIAYIKKEDYSLTGPNNFHPKHHELAHAYLFKGDTVMSRIYADSAIQVLEKKLIENPLDHRLQAPLSKCYAFLGDRKKAIEYGKQSIKALPVKVDALRGIGRETEMAKTYALLGEHDLALDKIEYLLSVPGFLTYGDLWTKPEYYALRDHPRFQQIISQGEDLQIP